MTDATTQTDDRSDEDYALDSTLIDGVLFALDTSDKSGLQSLLDPLHAADVADLLEQVSSADRERLIRAIGRDLEGETLPELEENVRDEVLELVDDDILAEAVKDLDSDDVVYLVEDMDGPAQAKLLDALEDEDRVIVEQSLTYPDESAGRMMMREVVTAPPFWNVGQMIDFMRDEEDLPDPFYDVIVTDPAMKPVGTIPLSRIMGARRPVLLSDIMDKDFRAIPVLQDEEEVAYAFSQYHLVSAPVVDDDGRLVGVITIDDAVEAMEEEAEEDLLRLAGLGDESLADKVWRTTQRRFPWLGVNLVTSILASIVIAQFEDVIAAYVALAVLLPIVASMGGNAGTQTLTVAVRALATKDLTAANMWRVVLRETLVGLGNGLVFAVLIGGVGYIWFGDAMLGVVLALAMVANLVVAGLAGIMIPLALDKVGADPALASGAFVTTVTDVVGFFAFLGLAATILI
ncbi:MAG: magnesium transporter [Pikeienuella sp.]